jgi:hypothetical protein
VLSPRFVVLVVCSVAQIHAQWLNYPEHGVPRTRDGKVNLSAKAPRAANGKPDLSGVWQAQYSPPGENERIFGEGLKTFAVPGDDPRNFSKYFLNILADFKPDDPIMRPEAAAAFQAHVQAGITESPTTRCLPQGIPRGDLDNYLPFKIIQTAKVIAVFYEESNTYRQIYTDGRPLPVDPQPTWMGYSVGHWEGDTLVVDATGFNDQGWLDTRGHPQSTALHIRERFHRRDFGHMDLELTIDDPKTYTRPFTVKSVEALVPDSDVLEYACTENERDRVHLAKP